MFDQFLAVSRLAKGVGMCGLCMGGKKISHFDDFRTIRPLLSKSRRIGAIAGFDR